MWLAEYFWLTNPGLNTMLRWPALSPVALASLEQVLNLNLEGCPINQSEERDCGWKG
jgi:hypothetical protein